MARIESVCVYCGSASGADPLFAEEARRFGRILAAEGVRLIYGGGGIGLMGEVASAVAIAGGAVTGIIPRFLMSRERAFGHEAEMIVVEDMHARKRLMFEQGSLGVVDPTGAYIGGAKRFNLNSELYFPVPGTGNDKSLRVFAFADTGNVWRDGETMTWDSLRASAGVGLSWISPVGPLKLSYGSPLRVQRNDRIQKFQFQIGTAF